MGHLLSVCLCSCHLHLLVSVSTLLFLYIDTAINTTIGIAVVHVVDESLKAIVEEASNTSVPQSQGLPSGQRNRFLVRACQVTGTVLDSDIGWNVTQPGADISDCVFTGETRSPILLTVPLEFLRNVSTDNDPNLFPTALRNFSIDPQQSPLRVILADEAKNQEGQDENDALKQRCPVQCVCQSNITNAVKTTAIEHAEPTKMAHPFVTLEEEAMSQRKQTGIPFPETLKVLVIKHTVDQPLLGETKGPAVTGSVVTRLNTSRGKEEERKFITKNDSFPRRFTFQPIWFYDNVNSLIQAVLNRRTKESTTRLTSAQSGAFYSSEVDDQGWIDSFLKYQQAFVEALQYRGSFIGSSIFTSDNEYANLLTYVKETEGRRDSVPNYQEVFILVTLQNKFFPRLKGQVISANAKCHGIIPLELYYFVVSVLAKRFPLAVSYTQTETSFNVRSGHILHPLYSEEYPCVNTTMLVLTEVSFASTATDCSDVNELIADSTATLGRNYQTVKLRASSVIAKDQRLISVFRLGEVSVMFDGQRYSVEIHSPRNCLWKVCSLLPGLQLE